MWKVLVIQCVQLFATPWTIARQASLSMGLSRQEYWSGLPFSSLGCLPDPGIKPRSPELQVDSLPSEPPGSTRDLAMDKSGGSFFPLLGKVQSREESKW